MVVTGDGANVTGAFSVTGNIQTTAGYFVGDGSRLTGVSSTSFASGTTDINIPSPDANINLSVNNVPNVLVVTSSGINVSGTIKGTTLTSTIATGTAPLTVTSTTLVPNLFVARANIAEYSNVIAQTTGTFYPIFVSASGTGNYQPGVNSSLSFVTSTGVLTATSFSGSSLSNGTPVGNISINSVGNVSISAAGTTNVISVTASSVTISKDLSVSNLSANGMATFYQSTDVMVSPVYTGTTVYTHDYTTGGVIYLSGLTGAVTINLTNIPTTLNRTIVVPVIIAQGATGYVPSLQIASAAQTVKWLGGTTPTATINKTEVFGFTLIRTSGGSWVVLGQLASYG
jgi:hypothetical protein